MYIAVDSDPTVAFLTLLMMNYEYELKGSWVRVRFKFGLFETEIGYRIQYHPIVTVKHGGKYRLNCSG